MIPLTRPTLPKVKNILSKLEEIFSTGMITNGKYVREFEKRCEDFLGVKNAIAVSSGMSAIMLVLKCLELDGEVILPSFTFTSSGHSLLWCGLKPVFTDINRETFNIDTDLIKQKITSKTSAIFPTHVFGNPCDIEEIEHIAKQNNLKVVYDAAHAFGSTYKGKSVACFGDAAIFSFTPTKVLSTGEGGLVATNNDELAKKIRLARNNGDSFNREEEFLGLSARMDEMSAILGIEGLKILKQSVKRRMKLVSLYKNELSRVNGISFQKISSKGTSVFKDMAIVIDEKKFGVSRDELLKELLKNKIETKVYFNPPLHMKKVYETYRNAQLPHTVFLSKNIIDLPLYSHMRIEEVKKVCSVVKKLKI